jgi:hypothetical protein
MSLQTAPFCGEVQSQTMLNFRVRLPCTSVIRAIFYLANREEKPLVRQKVESAGKIAQRGPAAMVATYQMADFKRDSPSRMAINMHNEPLRLF